MADMDSVVGDIVGQPFHTLVHPEYGTVMRMLDVEVPSQSPWRGRQTDHEEDADIICSMTIIAKDI